jgi:hypothetical protein
MGALEVSLANAFVEIDALLFESVEDTIGPGNAFAGGIEGQVEQQSQIRLKITMYPMLELLEFAAFEPAAATLVGVGGVSEAVADDPLAPRQRRFDEAREMFAAGRKHEQGFGLDVHVRAEQDFADFLADFGAAGLAGNLHYSALPPEARCQPFDVAALAGPVDALEGNEFASHLLPF